MKKTNRITTGLGDRWINDLEVLMDWFFEKYTDLFCEIMARSEGVGGRIELFDLLERESFKAYDRAFRSWKWEHFKAVARACDYFKAKSDG